MAWSAHTHTHMHTHQIEAFDTKITLTDSTTEASISFYSLSTMSKREDDIGWIHAFLMDMHILISSQIMTRAPLCNAL